MYFSRLFFLLNFLPFKVSKVIKRENLVPLPFFPSLLYSYTYIKFSSIIQIHLRSILKVSH